MQNDKKEPGDADAKVISKVQTREKSEKLDTKVSDEIS